MLNNNKIRVASGLTHLSALNTLSMIQHLMFISRTLDFCLKIPTNFCLNALNLKKLFQCQLKKPNGKI